MKTKHLLSLLILFLAGFGYAQEWRWGYVENLKDEWLRKIWTQGADTVYVVGENGLIARSIDRGDTWNKYYCSNQAHLNDIVFTDCYTGFAAGENGTILKTADAGETWIQQTSGTTENINALAVADGNNIWAVGNKSLVLQSTNGGTFWQKKNITDAECDLTDIAFRENLGYFTGNNGAVYKTENEGENWEKQTAGTNRSLFHSLNITKSTVCMLDDFSDEDVFFFNDGSWTSISYREYISSQWYDKLCFVNDSTGYLISYPPVPTCCVSGRPDFRFIKLDNNMVFNNAYDVFLVSIERTRFISYYDINFVNDTLGYAILGGVMYKTPLPQGLTQSIKEADKSDIFVNFYQEENNLLVLSFSNALKSVELLNLHGKRMKKQFLYDHTLQADIDISNIPDGAYIIKAALSDDKIYVKKWIKY